MKMDIKFKILLLVVVWFFAVIVYEMPTPSTDALHEIKTAVIKYNSENGQLPKDLDWIDEDLKYKVKQFNITYQEKGKAVILSAGNTAWRYNENLLFKLSFGLIRPDKQTMSISGIGFPVD